jgi:outer membrane lipoprotein SlyB
MLRICRLIAILMAVTIGLTACVEPPPRHRVVYHESDRTYDRDRAYADADRPPPPPDRAYLDADRPPPPDEGYADRGCRLCGTVRDVDQVEIRHGTSGGGALLGAIIGGAIGNQFGRGGGRAAATAAGVIGGAAVGNSVEENDARARSGYAWRFHVELDDGHLATVTQYENPGFHPGDRVQIRRDHLEYARR